MDDNSTLSRVMAEGGGAGGDVGHLRLLDDGAVVDGHWRVRALLGKGGNGEVYRVQHVKNDMLGALKMPVPGDSHLRDRFDRELDILQQIATWQSSPASRHLPHLVDHGVFDRNVPYCVIEYLHQLEVQTRQTAIRKLVLDVSEAVGELHRNGYLHRDIKLENLMRRTNGDVVLIDFGLAGRIEEFDNPLAARISMTQGRMAGVGTEGSSAPEQLFGHASIQSDVYALGALASHFFGGKPPRKWIPIIQRALNPKPEYRFRDVDEFVSAIRSGVTERCWNVTCLSKVALITVSVCALIVFCVQINAVDRKRLADEKRRQQEEAKRKDEIKRQREEFDARQKELTEEKQRTEADRKRLAEEIRRRQEEATRKAEIERQRESERGISEAKCKADIDSGCQMDETRRKLVEAVRDGERKRWRDDPTVNADKKVAEIPSQAEETMSEGQISIQKKETWEEFVDRKSKEAVTDAKKVVSSCNIALCEIKARTEKMRRVLATTGIRNETITGEKWYYQIYYSSDKTFARICSYGQFKGDLIIPAKLGGYDVREIGGQAFRNCHGLTSVRIPTGVTCIGCEAFDNCDKLTTVMLPESVVSIGDSAFRGCATLSSLNLPSNLVSIGNSAFNGCCRLAPVTIPPSVTNIGYAAFKDCKELAAISLPPNLHRISNSAFCNCIALTSVFIPQCVTDIGDGAFYGCSSIKSLKLPPRITHIGRTAFQDCKGLGEIVMPDGVITIGDWAFSGCSTLQSVSIPQSVTQIGKYAFQSCNSLTSISLPLGVKNISDSMFVNCRRIESFTIPPSVTNIGDSAFHDCDGLKAIVIPASVKNIGKWSFYRCRDLSRVTIIDGVSTIGDGAFMDCQRIATVKLPASVTSIGKNAFDAHCVVTKSVDARIAQ